MPHFLYIDTAEKYSQILVCNESNLLAQRSTTETNQHAQVINIHIAEVLHEANIGWQELEAVMVMNGPGSYTGLRIGLASAKGICFAHDIPLMLASRFELMHEANQNQNENCLYLIKARENEYYYESHLNSNVETGIKFKEELMSFVQQNHMKLYGVDENLTQDFESITMISAGTENIISLCKSHFERRKFADLLHSEPFYIKNVYINKIN